MNPFGYHNPPGMRPYDSDPSDEHVCAVCERTISQGEIDDDASEAFTHVCCQCAQMQREQDREDDIAEGAQSDVLDKQ